MVKQLCGGLSVSALLPAAVRVHRLDDEEEDHRSGKEEVEQGTHHAPKIEWAKHQSHTWIGCDECNERPDDSISDTGDNVGERCTDDDTNG